MYLFSRTARLAPGHLRESMAWSLDITEKVNQISELEVRLWTTAFSPGVSTLVWTSRTDDLAVLEATDAKLMADDIYCSLVDAGAKYASTDAVDDSIVQLVLADPDQAAIRPSYANVVRSALTDGSYVRGVEVGVEIAQRAKKIMGSPVSFGVAQSGTYGGLLWVTQFESVEQLQRAQETLNNDTSFAKFVDTEAKGLYQSEVTTQTSYRRLA